MKKLMFVAVCAMAVMISCKNAGKTAPADDNDSTSTTVLDSIIEENDTTPLPMFLFSNGGKYLEMLYWAHVEEPKKTKDNEDYYDVWRTSWELQQMFRRNAAQYTNLLDGNKIIKIKYVDEVLKDPDGNTPSIGEIHSREQIPSLSARFTFVNAKDKDRGWGMVVVTDSYLKSRKQLDIKDLNGKLPADIVKALEKEYGMKATTSNKIDLIGGRYTHGSVEFQGEYKKAPKDKYDKDRKYALAVELLIDSGKVYKYEQLGYYDEEYGATWNADADGYIPNTIVAAFEGPKGIELCFTHGAPESFCTGMIYLRDGKLVERQYEMYHALVDEEIPVWKKDFAEMDKLYHADEMGEKDVELVKYSQPFIDYDNEWIWLRDKDDKNGAFFIRKDGKFTLMAIENPRFRPSRCDKDGICYLKFEGSAGGPSWQREIHAFQNGKRLWKLNVLEVEGEIYECSLNDKDISKEEGQAYLDKVPEGKEINTWFRNINGEESE